jgi:hypothetical protein
MTKRKNKITLRVFKTEEEMNAAVAARLKAERAGLKTVYRNIEDFPWAQPVLAWAERGDWDTLAKYILDGDEITREIREFLAAVLRGEKKRPKRRPPTLGHLMGPGGALERVWFFISLVDQGEKRDRAINQTAEKYGLDRRTIERNIKENEESVRILIAVATQAPHLMP